MDNPKAQIVERIKQANNVLVTVSANPSVDQLSSAIGLTLLLNKLGKHATAVFSGQVPSTIEFLEPEKTLEKNTDSLRDFIIALDKSKADKLRYKVEENVVKIFITPYRTSISEKDLDFSQGDFNVDIVMALGVGAQTELDQAITAHGRILHDATVISINHGPGGELGSIHWRNASASSLSEMIVSLSTDLGKDLLDGQIATALLTGIVAETDRFSNGKTTPTTMSISATLMTAGANQQLVATKLEQPQPLPVDIKPDQNSPQLPPGSSNLPIPPIPPPVEPPKTDDGILEIDHGETPEAKEGEAPADNESNLSQIHVDDQGNLHNLTEDKGQPLNVPNVPELPPNDSAVDSSRLVTQPPSMGGTLTANSRPQDLEPTTDAMSLPSVDEPFLSRNADEGIKDSASTASPAATAAPTTFNETLSQLEQQIGSPHADVAVQPPRQPETTVENGLIVQSVKPDEARLDQARGAVNTAIDQTPITDVSPLPPIDALNALPVYDKHDDVDAVPVVGQNFSAPASSLGTNATPQPPTDQFPGESMTMPMPSAGFSPNIVTPTQPPIPQAGDQTNSMAPPPVPPPMMPFPTPPSP
jgi:nanoRNase/pAp phosphatase (c-di-AMP/oligoRNAs hydrolase)